MKNDDTLENISKCPNKQCLFRLKLRQLLPQFQKWKLLQSLFCFSQSYVFEGKSPGT